MEKEGPSNQVLLESINERFNMVFSHLGKQDEKFAFISRQVGSVLQGQLALEEEIHTHGEVLDEIRNTIDSFGKAIDVDALSIVKHEERITRLEEKVFR